MNKLSIVLMTLLSFLMACSSKKTNEPIRKKDSLERITDGEVQSNSERTIINCDSIYPGKKYELSLIRFDSINTHATAPNTLFSLSAVINGKPSIIISDSIFCRVPDVRFEDFNGDKVKDILLQNFSDVRSNWTYHLYLVDTSQNRLVKIKGFEEIKNPNYLSEYDLIDNMVVSGTLWSGFYKINKDTVIDLNYEIYDHQDETGTYEAEYNRALQRILKKQKP